MGRAMAIFQRAVTFLWKVGGREGGEFRDQGGGTWKMILWFLPFRE